MYVCDLYCHLMNGLAAAYTEMKYNMGVDVSNLEASIIKDLSIPKSILSFCNLLFQWPNSFGPMNYSTYWYAAILTLPIFNSTYWLGLGLGL